MVLTFNDKVDKIYEFEKAEGYKKGALLDVMLFETAGTLSTTIKNPYSGAIGLIQFMPSTLAGMGLIASHVAGMNFEEQLKLVRRYLIPYRAKLLATKDRIDYYLAILYPALIGKPDTAIMAMNGSKTYLQNRGLDIDKDGDIEKGDIREMFNRKLTSVKRWRGLTIAAAVLCLFLISKTILS